MRLWLGQTAVMNCHGDNGDSAAAEGTVAYGIRTEGLEWLIGAVVCLLVC